ncbi:MAG: hypothetical protein COB59_11520 [Rhodospirillaceae bacterium]|nr:MAG: hypothetical protein COB59_11520 [Rhodospirillaceae bacterium]
MEQSIFLESLFMAGIAECSSAIDGSEGLLFALFMVGLAGGASHCVGMCGPFVVSQVQARLETISVSSMNEFKRISGGALVPYHLGRGTTYMLMGAVAAFVSGQLTQIPALSWFAAGLLSFAALFFIGYALRGLGVPLSFFKNSGEESKLSRAWGRLIKPLFSHPTGFRGYGLGLMLGFIPCGLLYGALAAAAASGEWLTAVFGIMAFWLGTVPSLFGIGIAGGAILGRWPKLAHKAAPILLLINAGFLLHLVQRMLS